MSRSLSRARRLVSVISIGSVLLGVGGNALAQGTPPAGTTPADPQNSDNQMIIACMQQQDPALKKQDAIDLCKKKLRQGIDIDKPKKKHKPAESNETPPNDGK